MHSWVRAWWTPSSLRRKFGLSAAPYIVGGGGGTNYANGSAQTVPTTGADGYLHGLYNNVPIVTQIYSYLASVNYAANPNALYMISYGGNDLIWLQIQALGARAAALHPVARNRPDRRHRQPAGRRRTHHRGAQCLCLRKARAADGTLTAANATVVNEAATYSAEVWSGLGAAGVNFVPADVEGVLRYVSQNPTTFGFTPATVLASSPACGTTVGLVCAPAPTGHAQRRADLSVGRSESPVHGRQTIEADYIYSLLDRAERDLAAGGKCGAGRPDARPPPSRDRSICPGNIAGRMGSTSGSAPGPTASSFKNAANFPNTSGTPFGGTVGADYQTPGGRHPWHGGHRGQPDAKFLHGRSLHSDGRGAEPLCRLQGRAVMGQRHRELWPVAGPHRAPGGDRQFHRSEQTPMRTATRWRWRCGVATTFTSVPITTGPVVGVVLQQVRIDGFTETGTSGLYRPLVRWPDPEFGSQPTRLAWFGGPGQLAALRRPRMEP